MVVVVVEPLPGPLNPQFDPGNWIRQVPWLHTSSSPNATGSRQLDDRHGHATARRHSCGAVGSRGSMELGSQGKCLALCWGRVDGPAKMSGFRPFLRMGQVEPHKSPPVALVFAFSNSTGEEQSQTQSQQTNDSQDKTR